MSNLKFRKPLWLKLLCLQGIFGRGILTAHNQTHPDSSPENVAGTFRKKMKPLQSLLPEIWLVHGDFAGGFYGVDSLHFGPLRCRGLVDILSEHWPMTFEEIRSCTSYRVQITGFSLRPSGTVQDFSPHNFATQFFGWTASCQNSLANLPCFRVAQTPVAYERNRAVLKKTSLALSRSRLVLEAQVKASNLGAERDEDRKIRKRHQNSVDEREMAFLETS